MAKVATSSSLGSTSLQLGGGALKVGPMVKRKTPSELRGEQLKRKNPIELVDESSAPSPVSMTNSTEVDNGLKKPDLPKNPRYIDTRVDEVFPARKSRLRMLSGKENSKGNTSIEQPNNQKSFSMLSNLAAKRQLSCEKNSVSSTEVSTDGMMQAHQTLERCSQSIFRSVTEISSGVEKFSGSSVVDMNKALKGLLAGAPALSSVVTADSLEKHANNTSTSGNISSEFCIPSLKTPLDLTLKTKMRVLSSCSVSWIHRSIMCSTYLGVPCAIPQFSSGDHSSLKQTLSTEVLKSNVLHSWVYPQSTLPPSVITVLASAGAEEDFLRKRQLSWEESFRSLYYMLRKNICNIFYVCASHFVVMFTASEEPGKSKCNAYISQSTRSLRSLLKEHDVCFSMPLCNSKEEQVTTEYLLELSEIEKQNLGQTRKQSSLFDIDNSPQSLLAFYGNKSVHGLYDILLNYRSFLTYLSGTDVPVLYSPLPFQNASISTPEIKCMEMKRTDHGESVQGFCSSIEIKGDYVPSWIVCRVCSLLASEGKNFEASFITEHTSTGLNVALGTICQKSDFQASTTECLQQSSHAFGLEATVTQSLQSGFLKGLKYSDGSYTASLSPI
ncbi:hypothetical protein K2173_005638 [Erythroxylum novogranatense]|uniref:Protein downstream neighbor of Son n=1 Tax=Erythroxylum novogranatense TaxID=1862640 RepID=A0AAV8SQA2_9ROSI|nr:hypothetical protein K2173_005638 [Erythroxylum novogranatense]